MNLLPKIHILSIRDITSNSFTYNSYVTCKYETANLLNRYLKRIFKISWPETISNELLWQMAKEKPIYQQIEDRKWQWIGHALRKDSQAAERQVLYW
jgi:hypothetical protein